MEPRPVGATFLAEGLVDPTGGASLTFGAGTLVLTPSTPSRFLWSLPADQCPGCAYHPADTGLSPPRPCGRQLAVSSESQGTIQGCPWGP